MVFGNVLNDLARSPLRDLERDPTRLVSLKLPEGRERDEIYEALGGFKATLSQILESETDESGKPRKKRRKTDPSLKLPNFLQHNGVYAAELLNNVPVARDDEPPSAYEGSVIQRLAGDFMLSSYRFDEEKVIADIQKVTRSLLDFLRAVSEEKPDPDRDEKAGKAIRNGLTAILRENLQRLDEHLLFRADAFAPKKDHKEQRRFSSKKLRHVWGEMKAQLEDGSLQPDETNMELLKRLGFFTEEEIEEFDDKALERIEECIQNCLYRAWEFYDEIGERLIEAQGDFAIEGEEMQVDPRSELQQMTIFELIDFLFDKKTKGKKQALKDYNDAQVALNLFLRYLNILNNPRFTKAVKERSEFQRAILENVFQSGEITEANVYKDAAGDVVEQGNPHHVRWRPHGLRKLKPSNGCKTRVWWQQTRIKEPGAMVEKLLLKPASTIEDVHDIIATSFVLWDIKEAELRDPAEAKRYLNLARKVGENMGFTCREDLNGDKQRSELENGEFCVIDKTNGASSERSTQFPSIRIYGLTKGGVTFEIQFVPLDSHFMAESSESPNHHRKYETRRAVDVAKKIYRGSGYPRTHEILSEIADSLEKERLALSRKYKDRASRAATTATKFGQRPEKKP